MAEGRVSVSALVVALTDAQLDALAEKVAAKLGASPAPAPPRDQLLTAAQVAERLACKVAWVYTAEELRPCRVQWRACKINRRR